MYAYATQKARESGDSEFQCDTPRSVLISDPSPGAILHRLSPLPLSPQAPVSLSSPWIRRATSVLHARRRRTSSTPSAAAARSSCCEHASWDRMGSELWRPICNRPESGDRRRARPNTNRLCSCKLQLTSMFLQSFSLFVLSL